MQATLDLSPSNYEPYLRVLGRFEQQQALLAQHQEEALRLIREASAAPARCHAGAGGGLGGWRMGDTETLTRCLSLQPEARCA